MNPARNNIDVLCIGLNNLCLKRGTRAGSFYWRIILGSSDLLHLTELVFLILTIHISNSIILDVPLLLSIAWILTSDACSHHTISHLVLFSHTLPQQTRQFTLSSSFVCATNWYSSERAVSSPTTLHLSVWSQFYCSIIAFSLFRLSRLSQEALFPWSSAYPSLSQ